MKGNLYLSNRSGLNGLNILVTVICILSGLTTHSQQLIQGKVTDTSKQPIPFAHILIDKSNRGTVTNSQGDFQLYLQASDRQLLISSIGYKSSTVMIELTKTYYSVSLSEDLVMLGEVVITPKDYVKEFVKEALRKIDKNYPQQDELISGFLSERFSKDSSGKEYYHIVESQLDILKESYKYSHDKGQVKLNKSVNVTESQMNNEIKIYAGGHLAHRFDFVMRRDDFLDSTKFKKFNFTIADTLRYNGSSLIKVHYLNRDSTEYGHLFIDSDKLAFMKIEHNERSDQSISFPGSNKRIYIKVTTEYFENNGLWRIGYVNYETKFVNQNSFYLNSIFTTHDFIPSSGEIPYHERLHFSEYMLDATKTTDPDWNGITRPVSNPGSKQVSSAKKKKFFDVRRLEYGLEFYYAPYNRSAHTFEFQNNSINFTNTSPDQEGTSQGLRLIFAYRLNKSFRLQYISANNISGGRFRESGFGLSYRKGLGLQSRFSVEPRIAWHWIQYTLGTGTTPLQENFTYKKINFNSDRVQLFSGTSSTHLSLGISFQYEIAYRWSLNVGITFLAPVNYHNGVLIMEDENPLTNQRVFIRNGKQGLSMQANSKIMSPNYYVSSGVTFRF